MTATAGNQKKRIGIVGGGKAGLNLFQLFFGSSLTQVVYVVDRSSSAPAMVTASQQKIPTYSDYNKAQAEHPAEFIFEVTGVAEISKALSAYATNGVKVVSHDAAFIILAAIEESRRVLKDQVKNEMIDIKKNIEHSLEGVSRMVDGIEDVTRDMKMLAINARIEAARVGDAGRGFSVVSQQMSASADSVRELTKEIVGVSKNIKQVSDQMEKTLEKLT